MATRAPLLKPFSGTQALVVALFVEGYHLSAIAKYLGMSPLTARSHCRDAAQRVPGNLPPAMRLIFWYRGATMEQLTGDILTQLEQSLPTTPSRYGGPPGRLDIPAAIPD